MKYLIISIPKAGTHMITQATQRRNYDNLPWGSMIYESCPNTATLDGILTGTKDIARTHASYHPEYERAIREKGIKAIFLYRDPRDLMVSYYEWVKKLGHEGSSIPGLVDDVGTFLRAEDPITEMLVWFGEHIRRYIPWLCVPEVLPVKFEDLMGNRVETCQRIIDWWGTDQYGTAEQMAKRMKPSTSDTFRKGAIGDYQNYFTKQHNIYFEIGFKETMRMLGYWQ